MTLRRCRLCIRRFAAVFFKGKPLKNAETEGRERSCRTRSNTRRKTDILSPGIAF